MFQVCLDYAEKLDKYTGNIVLSEEEIEEQIQLIPLKANILLKKNFRLIEIYHRIESPQIFQFLKSTNLQRRQDQKTKTGKQILVMAPKLVQSKYQNCTYLFGLLFLQQWIINTIRWSSQMLLQFEGSFSSHLQNELGKLKKFETCNPIFMEKIDM